MLNGARVVLADEPAGSLDSEAGRGVLALLRNLNERDGVTIVIATHDHDSTVAARDGRIVSNQLRTGEDAGKDEA